MTKVDLKNKAISMRKIGSSYLDIQKEISVSKSTLSKWLSGLELSKSELDLLSARILKGRDISREKARDAHARKRLEREDRISSLAEREFNEFINNPLFLIGVSLYWAEGGKKNKYFQFVNSDIEMVVLMVKWIEIFLKRPKDTLKYRLFIHTPYKNENCEDFWALKIGVNPDSFQKTIYKPTPHTTKKNPEYKGCLRISITKIDVYYRLMAWQKLLIGYYK